MHRPLGRAPGGKGVIMRKTIQKVFPVMEHMNIPNTITITGLILGMLNIFFIVQEHYHLYYICALLAGIMDTLDGFAAKRLNQYSELGEQLDSLCDGINFVLVPAVFAVTRMDMRLGTMICAGIYCACGILRLGYFNILLEEKTEEKVFVGVPTTIAAVFGQALVWACTVLCPRLRLAVPTILLVFGLLMISRLRFRASNLGRIFFAVVGAAVLAAALIIGK